MGAAASAIKAAHHVPALKALYESKVAENASDEDLLSALKTFIESDIHCYRQGKRREGKKQPPHLIPEPSDEEMQARIKSAEIDDEYHEAPHPTQVKPCDDGYIITCGRDGPMHAPGIGVIEECINLSGTYHAALGKYHPRKDLYLREPTHVSEDKTHWLQAQLSYETGGENPGWRLSHILHWTNVFGESVTDTHTLYYTIHRRKDHAPPLEGWKIVNAEEEGDTLPSFEPIHPAPDRNPTKEWQRMYE
jgi:hypothetical protein